MLYCCVPQCDEKSQKNMHRFPNPKTKIHLFNLWMERIDNIDLNKWDDKKIHKNKRVCHKHFDPFCFIQGSKFLKHGSLPTLNLPSFSGDSLENCNTRFMKNSPNFVPLLDVKDKTEIKRSLYDKKDDFRVYANAFTITDDNKESIIKVEETTEIDPLEDTYEGLLAKYELVNKKFNDYIQKTETEINLILEFITNNDKNGVYKCPECVYLCSSVDDIRAHLLDHAESYSI